jgi:hypothetical protein
VAFSSLLELGSLRIPWVRAFQDQRHDLAISFILAQPQVGADDFDGEHFAIAQDRHWTSLAQALSLQKCWQHLVNPAKTCDNEVVQVHEDPPQ